MKKFLSAFLALAMVFAILPTGLFSVKAKAATTYKEGYYTYTVENGEATITDVNTSISGDITIPSTLGGYPVTSIGNDAFSNCWGLTSINIPEGVKSIGDYAFEYCTSLTSIKLPEGVTSIGDAAFRDCTSLTAVHITDIAKWCNISFASYVSNPLYYAKNLYLNGKLVTDLVIPEGVTSIGRYAFYYCTSLTSINIPKGVTSIGRYAFYYCTSLTSINIPEGVTSIGSCAFSYCTSLTSVHLPEGVTCIDGGAFGGCTSLTSINIPEGVTSIGSCAFEYCTSLTSIKLPEGVTSIGSSAFWGCTSLSNINIPEGVTSIGYSAFYNCESLTSINIPEGVTSIGERTFSYCTSLTSINIPEGVTSIGDYAFCSCTSLTNITVKEGNPVYHSKGNCIIETATNTLILGCKSSIIPNYVTSIGAFAFYNCESLTSINIPKGVTSIGRSAFSYCTSLTSIKLPEGVTSIGDYAFKYCTSLTSIKLPEGVTSIGGAAFSRCTSLTSINIPEGVTSIGGDAFSNCNKLKTVYYPCNKDIDSISIGGYNICLINAQWVAEHSFKEGKVTEPTCTEKGYTTYSCADCEYSYKDNYTLPFQHNYLAEITEPTCTELGYTTYTCQKCGYTYNGDYTNTKHNYTEVVTAPTCQSDGFTTYTCTDCGDTYKGDYTSVDHSYNKTVVPPTYTDKGYTLYTCTVCGYSYKGDYVEPRYAILGVKADSSDIGVTLSWDTYDGAVEYYAKVYDKDFTTCIKTITTTDTSAVFDYKLLNYNTDYIFIVTAKLSNGKYLQVANATQVVGSMVIGSRVVGHTVTMEGKGAIVNFLPVENATGYLVNVFENNANGTRIYSQILSKDATSARIMNNLTAGTKYVVMINAKVNGKYMPLADLRVNGIGISFTAPVYNPTSVSIVEQTATSIRFNWDKVRGATQYFIKVTEKETGKVVNTLNIVGKETATLARHTDGTRISPNTTYILQFYTYINSTSNAGAYGDPIDITTIDFEDVTVTARYNQNNNKINVSWNKTTNAVGYYLCFFKNGVETNVKYIDGGDKTVYEFIAPKEKGTYSYGIRVYEKNSSGTAYSPISMSNAIYM